MKKNAMLKIAAVVLCAVLLTTCAISTTFAKYATSGSLGSASARVAKWGVKIDSNVQIEDGDLFAASYEDGGFTVASANGADYVIAPGTNGSMTITNVATGTPEVSGKATLTGTLDLGDNWKGKAGGEYCPLVFTVGSYNNIAIGQTVSGLNGDAKIEDIAGLEAAVAEAIASQGEFEFAANEAVAFDSALAISWNWPLGDKSVDDTALGDAFNATVAFTFEINVEQTGSAGSANA